MLPLGHPAPQFGDSFPVKQLKIVATRGEIFSLKFTKYRLAAGLRPDPLGELKRSPRPASRNKGVLLLRGGEREGRRGEGKGNGRGRERMGGEGVGRGGEGGGGEGIKERGGRGRETKERGRFDPSQLKFDKSSPGLYSTHPNLQREF